MGANGPARRLFAVKRYNEDALRAIALQGEWITVEACSICFIHLLFEAVALPHVRRVISAFFPPSFT